jgi:membrane protease YdiL (CAAX protease family)
LTRWRAAWSTFLKEPRVTLGAALQNAAILGSPAAIYAVALGWRGRLPLTDIAARLGLTRGKLGPLLIALAVSVPTCAFAAVASAWTRGVQGSMLEPYVGVRPTGAVIQSIVYYGLIATGFSEELLFRGLIGGALFRRLSFWRANVVQSAVFTLPHLLILLAAPQLWALATLAPFSFGLFAGWTRHTSGSIAPGVLVHASGNIATALAVLGWSG